MSERKRRRVLHALRDQESPLSIGRRMRARRFAFFRELFDRLPRPASILDVGGTETFWQTMGFLGTGEARITILNLEPPPAVHPDVTTVAGDACHMPEYADGRFDVVFSNSVIEHVGERDRQEAMAAEVQRVGRRYFVQTPNLWFPIEPHFLFPYFQLLPIPARAWLLMHLSLSWGGRIPDRETAERTAREVRLLDGKTFTGMFPGARVYREKVLGLTKSFVVYGGW